MIKEPHRYNRFCLKCTRHCKQNENVLLIACPRHDPIPVQLEIKVPGLGKPRYKSS